MDRRVVTSSGVVKVSRLASRLRRSAQLHTYRDDYHFCDTQLLLYVNHHCHGNRHHHYHEKNLQRDVSPVSQFEHRVSGPSRRFFCWAHYHYHEDGVDDYHYHADDDDDEYDDDE